MKLQSFSKKAQITTFIILGIVVLISVSLLMVLKETSKPINIEKPLEIAADLQPIYSHLERCLYQTSVDGLQLIGLQGGFVNPPPDSLATEYAKIAYGYKEGKDVLVTKRKMELEAERYVAGNIDDCFNSVDFLGFTFDGEVNQVDVIIEDYVTFVELDYPLIAKKDGFSGKLPRTNVKIPIKLGRLHNISRQIVEKEVEDPDWIDLTWLYSQDMAIDIMPYNGSIILFSIGDNESTGIESSRFLFVNRFIVNTPPQLDLPEEIIMYDGELFVYTLKVIDPDDTEFTFFDNTAMFSISDKGVISFTPELSGEFNVSIKVVDAHNNYDEKLVRVIVEE